MPPCYRNTQSAFRRFLGNMQLPWSKPQRENLLRFAAAFFETRSLPIRRLARELAGPGPAQRHTDKRRRRFLGNEHLDLPGALKALLAFLLPRFGALPFVPVMLDWTFVGTTYAILWAQIPYRGRSFPLLSRVYPYTELNSTEHELALLRDLNRAWPTDAPRPLLLADRGFPKRDLVDWLALEEWYYLIRGTRSLVVLDAHGRRVDCKSVPCGTTRYVTEATVLHQFPGSVQVVIRALQDPETASTVRWILLTNLPESLLAWATRLYRHRMQPEQTHRDCKHGHFVAGFGLDHLHRLRRDRLERLLFCFSLCYTFVNLIAETDRESREWLKQRHWGLSLVTFGLDLIHQLQGRLLAVTKDALASLTWLPLWLTDEPPESDQPTPGLQRSAGGVA